MSVSKAEAKALKGVTGFQLDLKGPPLMDSQPYCRACTSRVRRFVLGGSLVDLATRIDIPATLPYSGNSPLFQVSCSGCFLIQFLVPTSFFRLACLAGHCRRPILLFTHHRCPPFVAGSLLPLHRQVALGVHSLYSVAKMVLRRGINDDIINEEIRSCNTGEELTWGSIG